MEKVVQTFNLQTCTRILQKIDNFETTTRTCLKDVSSTSWVLFVSGQKIDVSDVSIHLQGVDNEERTPGILQELKGTFLLLIPPEDVFGWYVFGVQIPPTPRCLEA